MKRVFTTAVIVVLSSCSSERADRSKELVRPAPLDEPGATQAPEEEPGEGSGGEDAGPPRADAAPPADADAATSGDADAGRPTDGATSGVAFLSVATGGAHTCALDAKGAAFCWGRAESGQLGVPVPSTTCNASGGVFPCFKQPVAVRGGRTFTRLAAGAAHTCALTADGSAYCWGSNSHGQLGDGSTTNRAEPVAVATALKFTSIDAGAMHTCALTSAGAAWCWGRNNRGQLGDGTSTGRVLPVAVTGGHELRQISTGGFNVGHTCALDEAGAAWCWGDNERGQLGIGSADIDVSHRRPAQVVGGHRFASLSAGLGRHTCALTSAGDAWCWGENSFGALGDGRSGGGSFPTGFDRSSPVRVVGGLVFAEIAAGGFIGHTCGITTDRVAYCWGDNEVGAIGDGTTTDRFSPARVAGGLTLAGMDAGFRHTCAFTNDGTLYCWGANGAGQLGIGSDIGSKLPARVLGQR